MTSHEHGLHGACSDGSMGLAETVITDVREQQKADDAGEPLEAVAQRT